jgi:hypothetical protein
MIPSIFSLLALSSSPAAAAPPVIDEASALCSWDSSVGNYYWSLNAHVQDDDADASWALFSILDRDDRVLASDYMALTYAEGTYSFWYYSFYEFPGGPRCPDTYRVVVEVYDHVGNRDTTDFLIREL